MTPPTQLEVRDLVCGYESFSIKEINLSVQHGGFVGIIGPNGSGKTTLLRAVTRVLKPTEGSIFLGDTDIRRMTFKELAKQVAVVSQTPSVPHITVEEYVLLGRIPHHRRFQMMESHHDLETAERCMRLTETLGFRHKPVSLLSGGERQLVLIARALAQQPRLLILDEPTSFLDITHQVRIMDLIKRLNRDTGVTVVLVLHDLNLAGEYCDHLVLMRAGRIFTKGTPAEVLTYSNIEEVYRTLVVVGKSPVSSRPYIFVVTEEEKEKGDVNGRLSGKGTA
ncbi:MAG: ABC transporter ATP-binding protein [bacterium]|nr:ABC transporter ATP-binding protein [bacterium]